jgi:hypothetical protein
MKTYFFDPISHLMAAFQPFTVPTGNHESFNTQLLAQNQGGKSLGCIKKNQVVKIRLSLLYVDEKN